MVGSGWNVGKSSALPQVPKSPCDVCAWHCFEGSQFVFLLAINARHLPTPRQPLTARNTRQVQVAVADCCDCRFWFFLHWCWFWLPLLFRLRNKSVPQNIACQAHGLPLPALVANASNCCAVLSVAGSCGSDHSGRRVKCVTPCSAFIEREWSASHILTM